MNVQEYVISELIKLGNNQIGYTESPKGSNRTKYGNFVDTPKSKGGPYPWFNGKKNGACGWCSVGINWENMMVLCPLLGDYDKVREFLGYPKPSENAAAGCPQMYSYLVAKWGKVAKDKGVPGDVIFFNNSLGKCAHVGRIIAVENGYYKTTEYNKGDKVAHGTYITCSIMFAAVARNPALQRTETGLSPRLTLSTVRPLSSTTARLRAS